MSEKMTGVSLPGFTEASLADWGDVEPAEIIETLRRRARAQITWAQAVLDAPDEAFKVDRYRGPYAMKGYHVIQEPKES